MDPCRKGESPLPSLFKRAASAGLLPRADPVSHSFTVEHTPQAFLTLDRPTTSNPTTEGELLTVTDNVRDLHRAHPHQSMLTFSLVLSLFL